MCNIINIILIASLITLTVALCFCLYDLFLIYQLDKNKFFAAQFIAIHQREAWRTYKLLKRNPELYQVFNEDNLPDEFLSPSTPYFILVLRNGNKGCFATTGRDCLLANAGGEHFLVDELISIKEVK